VAREEKGDVHPQGLGDRVNVVESDVPLASLDPAHVVAVEAGSLGEALLREALLLAQLSDAGTEGEAMGRDGRCSLRRHSAGEGKKPFN
jgi:hypothetical protein